MHQTRDLRGIAYCLEGLAAAAIRLDQPDTTAVLLAAAATIRRASGTSLTPAEQDESDDTKARATTQIGEPALAARSREGSTLSIEAAVDYARSKPTTPTVPGVLP